MCILSGNNPLGNFRWHYLDGTGFLPLGVRLEGEGVSSKIFVILVPPCQVSSGRSRRDVGGCTERKWSQVPTGCHTHLQSLHTYPLQMLGKLSEMKACLSANALFFLLLLFPDYSCKRNPFQCILWSVALRLDKWHLWDKERNRS